MRKNTMATAIVAGLAGLAGIEGRFVEGAAEGVIEGDLVEAKASFEWLQQRLQAALRAHYGLDRNDWSIYPEATYTDSIVVRRDGKLIQFPYTLGDNTVVLGEATEVVMEPVPVSGQLVEAKKDGDKPSNKFVIRVIRSGLSLNGIDYPSSVLREAAPMLTGVRVYAVSDALHVQGGIEKRDVGKLVGRLSNPRFVESALGGEILADLTVVDPAWSERFREAIDSGIPDTYAFSIDAEGSWSKVGRYREAKTIRKFVSVDVVAEPGAGGQLIRLAEAVQHHPTKSESLMNREQMLALLKKLNPARAAALATATDDQVAGAFREAVDAAADAGGGTANADLTEQVRMIETRMNARQTIAASGLPAPAIERLQAQFAAQARFAEADVTAAIAAERAYLSRFVETPITGLGALSLQAGEDRSDKVRKMLDELFDPSRPAASFREAYVDITGDTRVTGLVQNIDRRRFAESLGGQGRLAEAISAATFGEVLGDSITRAMVRDYAQSDMWSDWRDLVDVVPVSDFRQQKRTRMGGYGNLPAVAENGSYNALTSPGDEEATYTATKRGGTETISLEAIANDDVGVIRRIPQKMSQAAKQTLYRFVLDFMATNAAIYDTVALAHASHANLGTAALSAASFAAARLRMQKQAEAGSTERIGLVLRHLYVPADLEETAFDLFVRGTNNDETFVNSRKPRVHVVPYWTDANNWWATADKSQIPLIELGFYGGENPSVFIQDNPTQGSLFSNDQIKYKIRHIYSGAVLDFRGFDGNVVP